MKFDDMDRRAMHLEFSAPGTLSPAGGPDPIPVVLRIPQDEVDLGGLGLGALEWKADVLAEDVYVDTLVGSLLVVPSEHAGVFKVKKFTAIGDGGKYLLVLSGPEDGSV